MRAKFVVFHNFIDFCVKNRSALYTLTRGRELQMDKTIGVYNI